MNEQKEAADFKSRLDHDLQVWKISVETQMHFNELLIKMRTTVISVVLAAFGSVIVTLGNPTLKVHLWKWNMHLGIVITVFGVAFVLAHFLLDYFYYFRLLLGAVKFAEKIDKRYQESSYFGLTQSISAAIPKHWSHILLICFYGIPLITGIIGVWAVTCIYPIEGLQRPLEITQQPVITSVK